MPVRFDQFVHNLLRYLTFQTPRVHLGYDDLLWWTLPGLLHLLCSKRDQPDPCHARPLPRLLPYDQVFSRQVRAFPQTLLYHHPLGGRVVGEDSEAFSIRSREYSDNRLYFQTSRTGLN